MNLHQLRVFYVTAQHMSFTAAAQELFMTQPAVSLQVKALEKQLGVKLFERDPGFGRETGDVLLGDDALHGRYSLCSP